MNNFQMAYWKVTIVRSIKKMLTNKPDRNHRHKSLLEVRQVTFDERNSKGNMTLNKIK